MLRVCLVAGLAACGRWGFSNAGGSDSAVGDDDDAAMLDAAPGGMIDAAVRSMTMISGLSPLPLGKLDLGVSGTPTGFTLVFASAGGGDMFGVNLDGGMRVDGDWRSTATGFAFVGTSLTWTGVPMTTMTRSDDYTYIKRYALDLSSYTELAEIAGVGTKPTYAAASGRWFYAIVCEVLRFNEIASDGTALGSPVDIALSGASGARPGGTLVGEGSTLYAVSWHSAGTCQWAMADVGATITTTDGAIAGPCLEPRAAVEPGRAVVVMDDGASIRKTTLEAGSTPSAPAMIATGVAPRIERRVGGGFWLAWLVGFELHLATYAVGKDPANEAVVAVPAGIQAYELVSANGHAYLFVAASRQLWWAQLD